MKQKAFVVYPSWRYYMDLLEDPELITEFAYAMFDVGEGKEPRIANSKVEVAINAIKPIIDANNAAYEERCRKNKAAARRRWSNADADAQHTDANAYQSDANAYHSDGDNDNDNENDYDNDHDNDDDNDNKNCLSCQAGPSDIPSEAEVIQAAEIRGMTFSEEEARHFIRYYFVENGGCIEGEPIRSWRNLLKGWYDHTLISPQNVFGDLYTWHHGLFLTLSEGLRNRYIHEQGEHGGLITRQTCELIQDYLKERR